MNKRSTRRELLDLETPPRKEMARVVRFLAFVNRRLGGTNAVAFHLREVSGPITVLDVGSGAADVTRTLRERFPNIRPFVLDLSFLMLSFASDVPRVRGDGRRLPFADKSIDFVTATHFFHHLSDDDIVIALQEFDRVARRGIVVNDLLRRRRALFWIRLLTVFANRYVRTDGPISVQRGFTIPEIEAFARRAGVSWLRPTVHFGHRFTLAGERLREALNPPSTS